MNWKDRLKAAALAFAGNNETKAAGTRNATSLYTPGAATWGETGFLSMCRRAFKMNESAYSGIMRIADALAEAPLKVWTGEGPIEGRAVPRHPLSPVLARPNPFMTQAQLIRLTIICRMLSGNAFWEIVRGQSTGRPVEIWPLRPDWVRIVPDPDRFIAGYIYEVGGEKIPLPVEDVIHFKDPDPLDPYFGQSRLLAASRRVDVDNGMSGTVKQYLDAGGVPPFAAFLEGEIESDAHLDRMHAQWTRKFGGPVERRDTIGFMEKIRDIKPIGMNLNEMAFTDLSDVSEARILQCIGTPPIVAGALVGLQNATYANAEQFRVLFWENAISPLANDTAGAAGLRLAPELGDRVLGFDPSGVAALRSLRESEREKSRLEWDAGLITRAEFRRRLNLEERPGDDVYKTRFTDTLTDAEADSTAASPSAQPANQPSPPSAGDNGGTPGAPDSSDNQPPATPSPAGGGQAPEAAARFQRDGQRVTIWRKGYKASASAQSAQRATLWTPQHGKGCNCGEHKSGAQGLGLLKGPLGRVNAAKRFAEEYRAWARNENRYQVAGLKDAISRANYQKDRKALTPQQMDEISIEMAGFTDHAFETVRPLIGKVTTEAALLAGVEMGLDIDFAIADEAIQTFIKGYAFKFADRYAETSRAQMREVFNRSREEGLTIAQINEALDVKLEEWEAYRVDRIARTETIRSSNAGAVEAYRSAGVESLRWVTSSNACPYCMPLDGTEVSVGATFFNLGDIYQPPRPDSLAEEEPDPAPMRLDYEAVMYPPLHPNCECTIEAVV